MSPHGDRQADPPPAVALEEDAVREFDASPWSPAGGSACAFALSVVLDRLPWQAAFAASMVAVAAWAWRSRPLTGAALGVIAWLCVTGFDVHRLGDIGITGSADIARAAVLVLAGLSAASAHAALTAVRGHRRADSVWVDFHEAAFTAELTSAGTTGRPYRAPSPRDARESASSLESNKGNKADG